MILNEFLVKLVDDDCVLKNCAFSEDKTEIVNLISNFKSKLAISLSSSFFNDNIDILSKIPDINYLKSIISLPIFKESSNLLLITFDSNKSSGDLVLIDESDSPIHKNTDENLMNIEDNLANELMNSIKNYENSDNSLSLNVNDFFKNIPFEEEIKVQVNKDDYADFLALKNTEIKPLEQKRKIMSDEILDLKENVFRSAKRKVISDDIVDEILDLKEKKSVRQEIERHNTISTGEASYEITSSNLINELMYPKRRQNPENMLYKQGQPILDEHVEFRKLGGLVDLRNIDEKNSKDTILIGTCKNCNSKLVYYNKDIDNFMGEVYVELDNISDIVLKDYLYEYLNSENGMAEILYFSKGHNYIRAHLLKSVKIPIPSIETQKEIIQASREAREFFKTVDLLKKQYNSNILDYKHILDSITALKGDIEFDSTTNEITHLSRSWRHAYQGLIWPLAISYLSATKGGFEIVEKKDNYLKLFEFIAAFNSIILLSGLPDDVYLEHFNEIWDAKTFDKYKNMTFGTWAIIFKNLSEVYKDYNFASKLDEDLFKKITSDKIVDIIFKAKEFRNDEFHGAQSNSYEAKEIVDILDDYLEDVFDILDAYSNYKLIYTTPGLKGSSNGYIHDIILLNGPCAQPIYENLTFDAPLSINSLYLYNPKNNKKLKIKDSFMKFMAVDKYKKHWALFIYYKCDQKEFNVWYKCYQSKEDDYKESISSFKRDILKSS